MFISYSQYIPSTYLPLELYCTYSLFCIIPILYRYLPDCQQIALFLHSFIKINTYLNSTNH